MTLQSWLIVRTQLVSSLAQESSKFLVKKLNYKYGIQQVGLFYTLNARVVRVDVIFIVSETSNGDNFHRKIWNYELEAGVVCPIVNVCLYSLQRGLGPNAYHFPDKDWLSFRLSTDQPVLTFTSTHITTNCALIGQCM